MSEMPDRPSAFRRPSRLALAAALLVPLAACFGGSAHDPSYRDPASARAPEWTVGAPRLTLGREDAGPKFQLFDVLSAVRRPDGAIVLGDGTGELRIYDAAGRFVRSIGRKGKGPGEFQLPRLIARIRGDSLAVWDGSQQRLTVFDSAGRLGRTLEPRLAAGFAPDVPAIFTDGGFVVKSGTNVRAIRQHSGVYPDSASFAVAGADGAPLRELGRFPAGEVYVVQQRGSFGWSTLPFGHELFAAGSASAFYLADSGTNRISIYSSDGRLVRTIDGPFAPRSVSGTDLQRMKRERLDEISDPARRAVVERGLSEAPIPHETPAIGAIAADGDGMLWVQEYPHPGTDDAHWAVVAPDGRVAARVGLPRKWRIHEIGRDYILAGVSGENDVEQEILVPLRRIPAKAGSR
jgi:hypothetical protein